MVNKLNKVLVSLAVVTLSIAAIVFAIKYDKPTQEAVGANFPGTSSHLATSTRFNVKTSSTMLFATSTDCTSRVISFGGVSASTTYITFGDIASTTPNLPKTNAITFQGSTTVAFDSGIYGCNTWRAVADTAMDIWIAEFRSSPASTTVGFNK